MLNPREVTPKSIMPNYGWLYKKKTNMKVIQKKLKVMAALGVPYSEEEINNAYSLAAAQATEITKELAKDGVDMKMQNKEIIALIAYLQRLGLDQAKSEENKGDVAVNE